MTYDSDESKALLLVQKHFSNVSIGRKVVLQVLLCYFAAQIADVQTAAAGKLALCE